MQMTTQTSLASPPAPHFETRSPASETRPSAGLTPRARTAVIILCALWAAIFFASLFAPPLLDDADATHANAARHILTSGDWVTLYVNGIRYLEKAPLPYWLVAASFKLFGFNAFAAHLPQAVAVLLLALLGYRWAAKAFNPRTGLYTGIMVLTSAGVFLFTRIFIPEVWLSLFLATALYTFLHSLSIPERTSEPPPSAVIPKSTVTPPSAVILTLSNAKGKDPARSDSPQAPEPFSHRIPPVSAPANTRDGVILSEASRSFTARGAVEGSAASTLPAPAYPYLMWTALGLAVLTKGLVALVFFFGAAIAYLAPTGEYRHWRRLRPFTGAILFLAIAAPWHLLAGLRNTDGNLNGHPHGFFWFYFINEHFLRFLGKRYPVDYNKLPGYLFWSLHLVWLFPWALFGPLLFRDFFAELPSLRKFYTVSGPRPLLAVLAVLLAPALVIGCFVGYLLSPVGIWRKKLFVTHEALHGQTLGVRTTTLLALYSAIVLLFFSFSTNQEYYTFPAYLPLLMLLAAALTCAESTYSEEKSSRRWILFAHAALTVIGIAAATALFLGLWTSRHLPFVPDIGDLLAHRGVGDYTLSMSHLFDLTGPSFAALRLPAILAAVAFAFGPTIAWALRVQRRHLAATSAIALTSATFLIAAHIALVRFGPMLSSGNMAEKITQLRAAHAIAPNTEIMLYGDQSYGSSIPFYLGQQVALVEGRSSSMIFGSSFPDAPHIFLTNADLLAAWGTGPRKLLFVPLERRDDLDRVLPAARQLILAETSGKALITDRPLDPR
jgi:4-amino-4-deoxy-L-arabinose transferase-like glycosyltransferase